MTSEQFAYWLQGFVELNPNMAHPTAEQWKAIGEHLQTVFAKVTPPFPSKPNVTWPPQTPGAIPLTTFPVTVTC